METKNSTGISVDAEYPESDILANVEQVELQKLNESKVDYKNPKIFDEGSISDCGLLRGLSSNRNSKLLFWTCLGFDVVISGFMIIHLCPFRAKVAEPDVYGSSAVSGSVQDQGFCLPCHDLYVNDYEVKRNRLNYNKVYPDHIHNGDELCCVDRSEDLADYFTTQYVRVHFPKNFQSYEKDATVNSAEYETRPDVHVHLSFPVDRKEIKEQSGSFCLPLKRIEGYRNHSSYDFVDGNLIIPYKAVHYVYTQVPFTVDVALGKATQSIYRIRNGQEELLMQNSVFPCHLGVKSCDISFQGGIFLLEENDQLSWSVSRTEHLTDDKNVTFGIHRI